MARSIAVEGSGTGTVLNRALGSYLEKNGFPAPEPARLAASAVRNEDIEKLQALLEEVEAGLLSQELTPGEAQDLIEEIGARVAAMEAGSGVTLHAHSARSREPFGIALVKGKKINRRPRTVKLSGLKKRVLTRPAPITWVGHPGA